MHSTLLVATMALAILWRWQWQPSAGPWRTRWAAALSTFCLPPLMVVLAAAAVLMMGHHGTMMGQAVSPVGCWISLGILIGLGGALVYALGRGLRLAWWLRQQPRIALPDGRTAYCLTVDLPLIAQVGGWRSHLLVSQGWIDQLTPAQQQATLAHEQAHAEAHDTLCFFGLGIVRRFSIWLPGTATLWNELLLLRELRADRRAAQTHDPLLLAELLVQMSCQITLAQARATTGIGFDEALSLSRLEQRVNALLAPLPATELAGPGWGQGVGWAIALLPLITPWLHHCAMR
jgi:Zn-dependent protease with chaperone function